MPKGDLYFYLRRNDVREQLNEGIVTGVLAEIVLGVEFLHNAGIIYRELKPENILVTNDGHVKLTDYGLSKILVESRGVKTFIGTFEYMAPETIGGEFGQKADIWALGVLMYELYFGTNPFEPLSTLGDSQRPHNPNLNSDKCFQMNYEKFDVEESLNEHIGHISQNFRDLLKGLLEKDPERRLNLQQIKNHPFFKNVDWVEVQERRNVGPLKQFVCNNNFILFRDAVGEEYKRRKYTKNALQGEHYEINLFEFRNSN